jgi:hypothetical protein
MINQTIRKRKLLPAPSSREIDYVLLRTGF